MNIKPHRATVVLPAGYLLYRQSHAPISLTKLSKARPPFVWFAFEPGYGRNYGGHQHMFVCKKELRLLNISQTHIRRALSVLLDIPFSILNCNEQYSGGAGNMAFHEAIKPFLKGMRLDGTYIHDDMVDSECEGPSEVVLLRERIVPSLKSLSRHKTRPPKKHTRGTPRPQY